MTQTTKDHLPPQDIEVEQAVIGALLFDGAAVERVIDNLQASHFYSPRHAKIYTAITELYANNEPVDVLTVAHKLQSKNILDDLGGRVALVELSASVATSANVEHYAGIVRDKAIRRAIISTGGELAAKGHGEIPTEELLADAEQRLFQLSNVGNMAEPEPASALLYGIMVDAEQRSKEGRTYRGLSTGYSDLDRVLGGMEAGELIFLGARPSVGKTTLGMNIAANVARNGHRVGVYSLETTKEILTERILCAELRTNLINFRTGRTSPAELEQLAARSTSLTGLFGRIIIDDTRDLTPAVLKTRARRLKKKHDIEMIIIDYIQFMHLGRRAESRNIELAEISRVIKTLAKELSVPIIALSQLVKDVDRRPDRRPGLADLRDSGSLEQDADKVIFLHREGSYKHKPGPGETEVIVAKNRNGPTGVVKMVFLPEYVQFVQEEKREGYEQ